ncbi:diphthine synthase [Methanocorpusculum labreanum Z]|uniref:Diphthine synthase n=1 Tax=Methanocorpusculum labreanum (strain ATCC 43576 / DSM 4855 / Z) TaxID=410358 RepID=DPHB_METLZ|nr:diphthine synthase [Methanocorpusculum labreanum]A2SQF6.1 RecName: Full=Diphthine synthase; AltName: Full=Diphthamide biosynthesis methyltransferase [Methanocorpusculum labreanum Z]ABN06562.1 diphthine synthase [Methanocorpusculum labreanum Z]
MLTFIGLGLFDEYDVSVRGLDAIKSADTVFLEVYTSVLMGAPIERLEAFYGKKITPLYREDVEIHADKILDAAEFGNAVFLTAGDSMVATTHSDLRIRAADRNIPTTIIHGASITTAVCGLSGLQNYRFGKSVSVPFPYGKWFPMTPIEVISANLKENLHTLVFLDIQKDKERYMKISEAVDLLEEQARRVDAGIPLYVGIARAGSPEPTVHAGNAEEMKAFDFGSPLHILIVPATLHEIEREYLERFAGLC